MNPKAASMMQRLRLPATLLALAIFVGGGIWSVRALGLSPSDYDPVLLLVLLALAPLGLAYASVNMMLMGKALDVPLNFRTGFAVSAWANIAELLPLPGGAIVRAGALMQQGGRAGESSALVLAFALLWIGCAALAASVALTATGWLALIVAGAGAASMLLAGGWIALRHSWTVALSAAGLRVLGIGLVALRLTVAFAATGTLIAADEALLFALANILGSAAAIAPGGLGISEGLAAAFATQSAVLPAAAFLAVGLNRIAGLAAAGLAALVLSRPSTEPSPANA